MNLNYQKLTEKQNKIYNRKLSAFRSKKFTLLKRKILHLVFQKSSATLEINKRGLKLTVSTLSFSITVELKLTPIANNSSWIPVQNKFAFVQCICKRQCHYWKLNSFLGNPWLHKLKLSCGVIKKRRKAIY